MSKMICFSGISSQMHHVSEEGGCFWKQGSLDNRVFHEQI